MLSELLVVKKINTENITALQGITKYFKLLVAVLKKKKEVFSVNHVSYAVKSA